jgi:hypothetical protein
VAGAAISSRHCETARKTSGWRGNPLSSLRDGTRNEWLARQSAMEPKTKLSFNSKDCLGRFASRNDVKPYLRGPAFAKTLYEVVNASMTRSFKN